MKLAGKRFLTLLIWNNLDFWSFYIKTDGHMTFWGGSRTLEYWYLMSFNSFPVFSKLGKMFLILFRYKGGQCRDNSLCLRSFLVYVWLFILLKHTINSFPSHSKYKLVLPLLLRGPSQCPTLSAPHITKTTEPSTWPLSQGRSFDLWSIAA